MEKDIKLMGIQDLESYFNLISKIREGLIMMARANHNTETSELRNINNKYNFLLKEIMERINSLYEGENSKREVLNEEMAHQA